MDDERERLLLLAKAKMKLQSEQPQVSESPSIGETALRGVTQGASLGTSDEAAGIGAGVAAALHPAFDPNKSISERFMEAYQSGRDDERKANESAFKGNPKTAFVSKMLGGAIPAAATGGSSVLADAPIATAAVLGAVQGFGDTDADLTKGEVGKVALDTATGGALGAVFGKAAEKFQPMAESAAKSFGRRALGFNKGLLKKVGGIDKAENAVGTLLDEGGVIAPWRSISGMSDKMDVMGEVAGKTIGKTLKSIDEAGIKLVKPTSLIDDLANTEIPGLGKTISEVANDVPEVGREFKTISEILKKRGGESGDLATSFEEANYIKRLLGKTINWQESDAAGNVGNMTKKLMYHAINDSVDKSLGEAAGQIGDKALAGEFMKAKELYGAVSTAQKAAKDRITREAGNKMFGLTDWILGAGGVAATLSHGNPMMAVPLVVGKKLAEKYGAQTASSVANLASKIPVGEAAGPVGGVAAMAVNSVVKPSQFLPEEAPSAVKNIMAQKGSKYATILLKAEQEGPQKLAITDYVLSHSDPEYAKLKEDNQVGVQ